MSNLSVDRNAMPAIAARGLSKGFGEGAARVKAVDGVDFTARFGEMVYLVGPSGSGKTTLLSMLSGILRPDAGTVAINGQDIWSLDGERLAQVRLAHFGFVFQDYHLFTRLTCAENVAIPLILRHRPWNDALAAARQCLAVVGLEGRADLIPAKLSGGEQQRVAIARAIVGSPSLLILDEPTASLDGDTGKMVIAFVRQQILTAHCCVLIVTHDARIEMFADRVVHMEDGRVIERDRTMP
ncbi:MULTISPECIES: ABC transporter ATP-binding protein [unclassified Pseudomonas]|uniref:ABC transporter ATP-binding protein n=1 Tax=unclassified Pseudomonas TaxID=196821 RepID=UPI000A1DA9D1|nr:MULTISPECIES: ABC transporter ATP-binding protein [unclassified Pseudomonas]